MSLYNKLLEVAILPIGDFILGASFISQLKHIRKTVKQSEYQLNQLQREKLDKLLNYSVSQSNYYKGLNIKKDSDPYIWIKNFPILDKELLKAHQDRIITQKKKLIKQSSSGSSGVQSVVYWSKKEQSIHRATQILWWEWAGYKIGNPILQTGLSPKRTTIKAIKDFFFRTYYLFAFGFTKEEAFKALVWKQNNRERVLGGYAASLYVLSMYAKESDLKISFKSAISWGDKLFDHYRKSITDTFGCKVYETYATTEGMMIAAQSDLQYMYIMSPNVFLEILDDNGNEVPDGELGHVVVTSLNAYAMPLIRYKIGDLAIKLPKEMYPENKRLNLPLLQKVIGRDTDLVKTKTGKFMTVHSFTGIFEYYPEIKQFCVIQENLDGIYIQYIPDKNFNDIVLSKVEKHLRDFLNEDFVINFMKVDFIPPTNSGKPQIIISMLPKNLLTHS